MIETFFESLTVILAIIGVGMVLHFLAFMTAWGWYRGIGKVKREVFNYHIEKK
jgi:Na+-transporting methylmalonyl-CoA/oxaloacetate decarboxylase gamma subunit